MGLSLFVGWWVLAMRGQGACAQRPAELGGAVAASGSQARTPGRWATRRSRTSARNACVADSVMPKRPGCEARTPGEGPAHGRRHERAGRGRCRSRYLRAPSVCEHAPRVCLVPCAHGSPERVAAQLHGRLAPLRLGDFGSRRGLVGHRLAQLRALRVLRERRPRPLALDEFASGPHTSVSSASASLRAAPS